MTGPADDPPAPLAGPYAVALLETVTYQWCACGVRQQAPWCDGHHETIDFQPVLFSVPRSRTRYLCGCLATRNPPFCDGSHGRGTDGVAPSPIPVEPP